MIWMEVQMKTCFVVVQSVCPRTHEEVTHTCTHSETLAACPADVHHAPCFALNRG